MATQYASPTDEEQPTAAPTDERRFSLAEVEALLERKIAEIRAASGGTSDAYLRRIEAAGATQQPDGSWVRRIEWREGEPTYNERLGKYQIPVYEGLRPVAISSLEEARQTRRDFFDTRRGCWIRDGIKPEKDHPDNLGSMAKERKVRYIDADPASIKMFEAAKASLAANAALRTAIPAPVGAVAAESEPSDSADDSAGVNPPPPRGRGRPAKGEN